MNVQARQKIFALIPAGGTGARLGDSMPKQYLALNGAPMIHHTLHALARVPRIERLYVVLSPKDQHWHQYDWSHFGNRLTVLPCGGESRAQSVLNGLHAIRHEIDADDWIMVHDAARPCLRPTLVEHFIDALQGSPVGGLLAVMATDTLKSMSPSLKVNRTIPRENIWRAQTPQMFRYAMLMRALAECPNATDESQAIEVLGHHPQVVSGDNANIKVTYSCDMQIASFLLQQQIQDE